MPELPEVETTKKGIEPFIKHKTITQVISRCDKLRWDIPKDLPQKLEGQKIISVQRRSKYLLLNFKHGVLIIHLGMSGNLKILQEPLPYKKHDHFDIELENKIYLRYHDPRRFGCILWSQHPIEQHQLFVNLGPEPLGEDFSASYLYQKSRSKKQPIKNFIMNSHIVVGIGNIYASEALFHAQIHPQSSAKNLSLKKYTLLAKEIKHTLLKAIKKGGTTLKDFTSSDGKPGYFQQELMVYNRHQDPCKHCSNPIEKIQLANRSTFFCKHCQHLL